MQKRERMKDWFFEGYQDMYTLDEQGRKKRVTEYSGAYYIYEPPITGAALKRGKRLLIAGCAALAVLFVAGCYLPSAASSAWPGIVHIASVVPLLYLFIGTGYYAPTGLRMTVREYRAGMRHILLWSLAGLFAEGAAALCALLYAVLAKITPTPAGVASLLCIAASAAIYGALHTLFARRPCSFESPKEKPDGTIA